jgi:hypothetical protein
MTTSPPVPFLFARSEQEIVVELRQYLKQWHPEWRSQLPERSRPGEIQDAKGIADKANAFTRTLFASEQANEELVTLEALFARASSLLSVIRYRHLSNATDPKMRAWAPI